MIQLPTPILDGATSSRCIEDVMRPRTARDDDMYAPGQEALGHFLIPPFQRPRVWTDAQSARLIESVHLGVSVGSIVVTGSGQVTRVRAPDGRTTERFSPTSDWLIDGLQRLTAIDRYLRDDLVVFRGTAAEHRFGQLDQRQRRRLLNSTIGYIQLPALPEDELRRIYDVMAFGGTAHHEEQRASDAATR